MASFIQVFILWIVGLFVFLSLLLYFTRKYMPAMWARKALPGSARVLIIIAHPDDECLFFGPTILSILMENGHDHLYLLCLSPGDYEGKGIKRKEELWQSCARFGFLASNITLLKYDRLKDGPTNEWNIDLVSRVIEGHVISYNIDTVITFDGKGVSGHRNHISIYHAVTNLLRRRLLPQSVKVYVLDSVGLVRKYGFLLLDIGLSYTSSRFMYVIALWQRSIIVGAMECHQSQMTWYRKLYFKFSRYVIMNTLREVQVLESEIPTPVPSQTTIVDSVGKPKRA